MTHDERELLAHMFGLVYRLVTMDEYRKTLIEAAMKVFQEPKDAAELAAALERIEAKGARKRFRRFKAAERGQ